LKKLEDTGNALPWARISLRLGLNPEIIFSWALHKGNRDVMKLLTKLDAQESTAMLALSYSSLRDVKYTILSYAYSRRHSNNFCLQGLH